MYRPKGKEGERLVTVGNERNVVTPAYDSVHLAAFASVAQEAGVLDTRFSSFDAALNRAARALRRTLPS